MASSAAKVLEMVENDIGTLPVLVPDVAILLAHGNVDVHRAASGGAVHT